MTYLDPKNPIDIAQALIKCPSITPNEGGAIDLLENILNNLDFECTRLPFNNVDNLYAEWGKGEEHFCFAGHTDVVPTGDVNDWEHEPFSGKIDDTYIHGRGAADMKGGIAAFIAATAQFIESINPADSKISLLITGDEEGPAINGTKKVLEWMEENGKIPDHCIVGEPTNPHKLGEMMKVGSRGSMNGEIIVTGTQGHVAYPDLADNPVPKLLKLLIVLNELKLDNGSEFFQPSNLEITNINIGNDASNVIPAKANANFNIRFNDKHSGKSLIELINNTLSKTGINGFTVNFSISGESFITEDEMLAQLIKNAVKKVTNTTPDTSTTGGTSDARFITNYCPVIEFGAVGETMHKIDERIKLEDLKQLTRIYSNILELYFHRV